MQYFIGNDMLEAYKKAEEMHEKEMKDFAIELSKIDCRKTGTDILIDEAENLYNKIYKQPCL